MTFLIEKLGFYVSFGSSTSSQCLACTKKNWSIPKDLESWITGTKNHDFSV